MMQAAVLPELRSTFVTARRTVFSATFSVLGRLARLAECLDARSGLYLRSSERTRDSRVNRILLAIHENSCNPDLTLTAISRMVHMSGGHVTRLLREHTGTNFRGWTSLEWDSQNQTLYGYAETDLGRHSAPPHAGLIATRHSPCDSPRCLET